MRVEVSFQIDQDDLSAAIIEISNAVGEWSDGPTQQRAEKLLDALDTALIVEVEPGCEEEEL